MVETVAHTRSGSTTRDLISLTKPRVTLLVIITALGGVLLSPSALPPLSALLFLLATATIVGSANALNCWIERDSDRHMSRTESRPLPAGRLPAGLALWFGLGLGVVSVPALALVTNPLTAALGAVALGSYVLVYTPLKRRSPTSLYVGAIAGAMPPLMGWTAATGRIDAAGLSIFAILYVWQLPHFLAIAIRRREEYERAGLMSLAVVAGERRAGIEALVWTAMLLPISLLPTWLGVTGALYAILAGLLGLWLIAVAVNAVKRFSSAEDARLLFHASMLHLALLMGALVADRVLALEGPV